MEPSLIPMHRLGRIVVIFGMLLTCRLHAQPTTPSRTLWSNEYLAQLDHHPVIINKSLAQKLVVKARSYSKRRRRGSGHCMRGFRVALHRAWLTVGTVRNLSIFINLDNLPNDAGNRKRYRPGRSADNFARWAKDNPKSMCQVLGIQELSLPARLHLRPGMILVYNGGTCGFSKRYGHIEIVTDSTRREVCSDHCRIASTRCQPDMVLAPVEACAQPLYKLHQQKVAINTPIFRR